MIAALYIDPRGPYPKIGGVDCWDETRDARLYQGTDPVVAHPPCGPWGRLKAFSHGHDKDCAPIAVGQVRRFGGVLEHPVDSTLWSYVDLPKPGEPADGWGGYTIEVKQSDWGHVALKRTWLYLVRVPRAVLVTQAPREPTHKVTWDRRKGQKSPLLQCSAQARRRTPPHFALYLITLAGGACRF